MEQASLVEETGITKEEIKYNVRLDMEKIREGDNDTWKLLLKLFRWKLEAYAHQHIERHEDVLDIVSDAVADVYSCRRIYTSSDQIARHLMAFVKWKRADYFIMKRCPNTFILHHDIVWRLDWYLRENDRYWESTDPVERAEFDDWRDQMLDLIKKNYRKLPREWKDIVEAHLIFDNMRDTYSRLKIIVKHRTDIPKRVNSSFAMLREILRNKPIDRTEMLRKFRETLGRFSPKQREVVKMMVAYKTKEAILATGKFTNAEYMAAISLMSRHIKKLDVDARISTHTKRGRVMNALEFFAGEKDEDVQAIFDEMIFEDNPIRDAVQKASKAAFTYDQFKEAIRLRQEGCELTQISRKLGFRNKINWQTFFKRLPKEIQDTFPPLLLGGRPRKHNKITEEQAEEIGRRLANGEPITRIANDYAASPETIRKHILKSNIINSSTKLNKKVA